MFNDVDETLRQLLIADVPVNPAEVEISFERPSREWSSRLTGPTINVFLFDIRERQDFRDDTRRVTRGPDGTVTQARPPRRLDVSYIVTAWAREAADEHRILGRIQACLFRNTKIAPEHLAGSLADATLPVMVRDVPPDHLMKAVDFWGVMDNELRTSLTWVATVPLDVFRAETGPMVLTRDLSTGPLDGTTDHRSLLVAGYVRTGGSGEPVVSAAIAVDGHAAPVTTDRDGAFRIGGVRSGPLKVTVTSPDGRRIERTLTVPAASYDIEFEPATRKK